MRCKSCAPVGGTHEAGCASRQGSELYRTETAEERAALAALLARLLRESGLAGGFGIDQVQGHEETWEYARREVREGREPSVRVYLDDETWEPWLTPVFVTL